MIIIGRDIPKIDLVYKRGDKLVSWVIADQVQARVAANILSMPTHLRREHGMKIKRLLAAMRKKPGVANDTSVGIADRSEDITMYKWDRFNPILREPVNVPIRLATWILLSAMSRREVGEDSIESAAKILAHFAETGKHHCFDKPCTVRDVLEIELPAWERAK